MFGIGSPELFVIIIIALLFVGPDKLPQVAKTVGTGLRDLRRMANLTQTELQSAMSDLAREVERMPEAKTKAELDAKLATLPVQDDDAIDRPPPTKMNAVPVPSDGETLAVVAKRPPPLEPSEQTRTPGPPAPHFVVKPADGARARGDAAEEATPAAPAEAPEETPSA